MIPFRDDVPAKRYPMMTVCIILANVAVFIYQLALPRSSLEQLIYTSGVVPAEWLSVVSNPQLTSLPVLAGTFTSLFLHGGWLHLLGNMWYLWIFGDNIEDRMGHFRFLVFYLFCGSAATIAHVVFNASSPYPAIGASGAVAGVLGAYLFSYPFARVLTLIPLLLLWPVIELPAVLVLGSWFLIQLLNGAAALSTASAAAAGVAWWAHVGGFIAGVVLLPLFARSPVNRKR
jgi:membrane associated rhomboid family serine protease